MEIAAGWLCMIFSLLVAPYYGPPTFLFVSQSVADTFQDGTSSAVYLAGSGKFLDSKSRLLEVEHLLPADNTDDRQPIITRICVNRNATTRAAVVPTALSILKQWQSKRKGTFIFIFY
jgi:hypothetical protein